MEGIGEIVQMRPGCSGSTDDSRVNVCYLIDNLSVAGTEKHLIGLIDGLDRTKIKPTLVLLDGESESSRILEPKNCEIHRLGLKSFLRPSLISKGFQFIRLLRKNRIDVLQMYFPDSTYFGALFGRIARVPMLVRTRRNIGYWMGKKDYLLGRLVSLLVHKTIANSNCAKQSIIETERARPDTVHVIPNALDFSRFREAVSREIDASSPRIGMVANLRPVKNCQDLIKAAKIVLAEYPNATFSFAGHGESRDELVNLAHEIGVEHRFEFLGKVDNIPNIFLK